jgi:hypothetical protein
MHHPEEPALAGILDVGVRGKLTTARRDADVAVLADQRIDAVRGLLVVDQATDDGVR